MFRSTLTCLLCIVAMLRAAWSWTSYVEHCKTYFCCILILQFWNVEISLHLIWHRTLVFYQESDGKLNFCGCLILRFSYSWNLRKMCFAYWLNILAHEHSVCCSVFFWHKYQRVHCQTKGANLTIFIYIIFGTIKPKFIVLWHYE